MQKVLLTDSFLDALRALDPVDAKRVALFLDRLLGADIGQWKAEIVRKAADRAVRSLRVTHDIRAIAHLDGATALLLYVARHDRAYNWALHHCVECYPANGEYRLVRVGEDPRGVPLATTTCGSRAELCRAFDGLGIAHGLDPA